MSLGAPGTVNGASGIVPPASARMGVMPELPSFVPIAGAAWRPLDPADAPALTRQAEAARIADGGEEVRTKEDVLRELTDPQVPAATNTLGLVDPAGEPLAWAIVRQRLDGRSSRRVFLAGAVHPAHRGRGIGRALLAWAEARGREVLAAQPDDLPRQLEAFLLGTQVAAVGLHQRAGFTIVRHYTDMRRNLADPLPPLPDLGNLRIEPYDPARSEAIRSAQNEAFADHWASEPITRAHWERDVVGHPSFRPDISFLVFDGDAVAGQTINYLSEADWAASGVKEAWIGQLGVCRPWRGRGVATALLVRSMEAFRALGLEAASLGVDTENPTGAVGLYERVGFRATRQYVRLRKAFEDPPGPGTATGSQTAPGPRP